MPWPSAPLGRRENEKVKIPNYRYTNNLGEQNLKNIFVFLDDDDKQKLVAGEPLEDLDYGLPGDVILKAERQIAAAFFLENYRSVLEEKKSLSGEEIAAIQNFLGVNNAKMAQLLFIDKASLTNIYKRKTASRVISGIALERLAMELARPGSAKRMVDASAAMPEPESEMAAKLNAIRYGA